MAKFRKKPVVVEAVQVPTEQFNISGWDDVIKFLQLGRGSWQSGNDSMSVDIFTLEGKMRADAGDWIIKGVKGEFYPCKPDIFAETYEKVED